MSNLNKQYDTFCKQILARPIFLAYILKRCIHEFSNVDVFIIASKCIHDISVNQKEVHRLSPFITQFEDDTLEEGKAVFDIFFMAHLPESDQDIDFYINIEIQDDFYPGYPLSARGGSIMAEGCFPCSMRIRSKVPVMKISRRSIRSGSA